MLKYIRVPAGILALTIAAPVLAQPATPTMSGPTSPPAATANKTEMVDLNSATAPDKAQLVTKKVLSDATYEKIKDHVVAKHPKS